MDDNKDDISSRCLKLLLLPVMRFCLRRSLKLQEVVEACKAALIEAAEKEIAHLGGRATINRLSLMTGIHRADVLRLSKGEEVKSDKTSANIVNRLIAQWQSDKRFVTSTGKPRILTFDGKEGEFAKLINSVSSDPNPYSILFELERIGAVETTPRGIRLKTQEYIISSDVKQSFSHLAQDSDDLITAVEENIFVSPEDPNLHLRTEYDNIGTKSLPVIRRWLVKEGSAFHRRMREFLAKYDRDLNKKIVDRSPPVRVAVCSFSRIDANYEQNEK